MPSSDNTKTSTKMRGYLGIDNGTQGLSVIFTDEELKVLATGEGSYDMVSFDDGAGSGNVATDGWYEQRAQDWDIALQKAMAEVHAVMLRKTGGNGIEVLGIGISGQMHGQVLSDGNGEPLAAVRLWCDARNQEEGQELTKLFDCKIPKRCTVARWLWTIRNQPAIAKVTKHMTTPAGWTSRQLTGDWTLGVGDAAGMFPIDPATGTYNTRLLDVFNELVQNGASDDAAEIPRIEMILPKVRQAGQDAGTLGENGAKLLGLPPGIPVAAAEGDQPAALAGSLIGKAGMASISFGTSVCTNVVAPAHHEFAGVHDLIDHFCAPDGKPIHMVWLRNGTTFLNTIVNSFGSIIVNNKSKDDKDNTNSVFETIMPLVCAAPADCGGILALPFMDDEPGMHVSQGGTASLLGLNAENAAPGNMAKAALLSTMFNLKLGCSVLHEQNIPLTELILTGGLSKTPECGQILADVFDMPVILLDSADEGCSWGAAVLAKYRHLQQNKKAGDECSWAEFLDTIAGTQRRRRFVPQRENVPVYKANYQRYRRLLKIQPLLDDVVNGSSP